MGGGVDWIATNGTCHMAESRPNGNGWTGSTAATNSATTSCTASVEAVCAALPAGAATQTVRQNCSAGRSSGCTATCPAGTKIVGGGVDWIATNGTCHMAESRPNGNGWTGSTAATNSATTSCTAAVEAICLSAPSTTAANDDILNTFNQLTSFAENGVYQNTCIAHAQASYVGFEEDEKELLPYT